MQYEFTRGITADTPAGEPRRFSGGEVIDETEIASGCLESCLRLGILAPVAEKAEDDPEHEQAERVPQSRSKKKSKQRTPSKAKGESPRTDSPLEDQPRQEDVAAEMNIEADAEQPPDGREE